MLARRYIIPWKEFTPVLGGVAFFFLLFLHGLINSLTVTYMGHRSELVEDLIFGNFFADIVLFILKIAAVYLLLGITFGIVIYGAICSFMRLIHRPLTRGAAFFITMGTTAFIVLIFFLKDLVRYPQVYMNNFYQGGALQRMILDFTADTFSPPFFTQIQIVLFAAAIGLIVFPLLRIRNSLVNGILLAAVLPLISVALFSRLDCSRPGKPGRPNVLILAADALRPDHLSGYGYYRRTSPHIDELIADGVSFRNAFIEVPRTFPSWVSLLTGQYASTHGIRHMFPASRDLNRDFKTMAEFLGKRGYYTAVVADYAGDIFSRIDLGFEKVDTPSFNFNTILEQAMLEANIFLLPFLTGRFGLALFPCLRDSAYFCPPGIVTEKVIDSIRESHGRPFFVTAFFSSTHFPYAPPYPYYKMFSKGYQGPYKYYKQRIISLEGKDEATISKRDIEQIRALYDGGIRAFDGAVGEIVSFLREKGILDETVILVLSDHGENLYEGDLGHGHGEHFRGQYAIKIPFILRYPPLSTERRDLSSVVRHVDVAPTLLSLLGEEISPSAEGVSLLPIVRGERKLLYAFGETGIWFDNDQRSNHFFQKLRIIYPDITRLAEIDFERDNQLVLRESYRDLINVAKHRYIFDGRYKLIYMPLRDGVRYELYDILVDSRERVNIADKDRYNLARLKRSLFRWITRNGNVKVRKDFVLPVKENLEKNY